MRWLIGGSAAAILAIAALAQDDKPEDLLRQAIARTVGGFEFDGNVEHKDDARMQLGALGMAEPFEGKFQATVRGSEMIVRTEGGASRIEVFRKGEQAVHRETWRKGKRTEVERFSRETGAILDLGKLQQALGKAKLEKAADEEEATIVKGTLPAELFGKSPYPWLDKKPEEFNEEDLEKMQEEIEKLMKEGASVWDMAPVKSVRATFRIDKKTGRLARIELEVRRSYGFGMGDDDEEEELESATHYRLQVKRSGEEVKVEFPEEIRRALEEK